MTFAGFEYLKWTRELAFAKKCPSEERQLRETEAIKQLDRIWSALTANEQAQIRGFA